MTRLALLLVWLALLLGIGQAHAQLPTMEIHVHAGLEAETLRPAAGSTVTLAITMRPDKGWHGYWSNPGDAGEGLNLDWQLPPGATVGDPRFPVPETLIISGFMNYVFERPHAILIDLQLPAGLRIGTKVPVRAEARWLACTDRVCVPQRGLLAIDLFVGDGKIERATQKRFDSWRAALPVPLDRTGRFSAEGKSFSVAIPYPATAPVEQPYFFPLANGVIAYAAPQKARRVGDWLVIETQIAPSLAKPPAGAITGVIRYGPDEGLIIRAVNGAVPVGGTYLQSDDVSAETNAPIPPLFLLLFGALLGGLILNIMPCVFPILGLKAVALAKAGGSEAAARADALAYTAGVVFSCVVLGGVMLLLRASGQQIGWAFQLQEPVFVLFLLLMMVAIAANLAGFFEIGSVGVGDALARTPGLVGSFWTGVLAAVVATPCTGPFMAAAMGAALLLPAAQALALFAALGIGISMPFLAIAYFAPLRRKLPKPGPWLHRFRQWMAVPMALTAFALSWLLWRLTGSSGLLIGSLASCALLVILVGFAPKWLSAKNIAVVKILFAVTILIIGARWLPHETDAADAGGPSENILAATAFSDDRLAALRASDTPVFLYFTADWCVTCKINEAAVLERRETAALFAKRGITVLRGDYTRRSPQITRFLSAQKAAGVPLYLYYPKDGQGVQLPQVLTFNTLDAATAN
jgi:DsbC/DsbD-like thiol-disulfide interchange protein/cytochrome c biogenesis protein CcdA